jgi:hypothetical protein
MNGDLKLVFKNSHSYHAVNVCVSHVSQNEQRLSCSKLLTCVIKTMRSLHTKIRILNIINIYMNFTVENFNEH